MVFDRFDPGAVPAPPSGGVEHAVGTARTRRRRRTTALGVVTTAALVAVAGGVYLQGPGERFVTTEPASPSCASAARLSTSRESTEKQEIPMRPTTLTVLTAVAVATGGCTAATATTAPPSASGSVSSSGSSVPRTAVPRTPVAPGTSTAPPSVSPPMILLPKPDRLAGVDWHKVPAKRCGLGDANAGHPLEVRREQHADVTGDGAPEALIVTSCGKNSDGLDIYDGASPAGKPRRLPARYFAESGFAGMRIVLGRRSVRITAAEFTVNAPTCCPDFSFSQTLTWDGSRFVAGKAVHTPL
jgi:hypothetical protein